MRTSAFFLFGFLLLFTLGYGAVFTPELEMDIRSFINVSMKCHHIPGMTLTVVKGKSFITFHTKFSEKNICENFSVDS